MRSLLLVLAVGSVLGAASRPKVYRIDQAGKKFSKAEIRIIAGDSIRFVNNDKVMHNVFSTVPGFKFNLKTQRPGTSKAVPFVRRGTAFIRCAFHPTMRLTVVVK